MDSDRWQRVASLFESVLDREPSERGAFLATASGDDVALRREVESLLEQEQAQLLIDRPLLDTAASVLDAECDLQAGAHVGPYRINHLIGAGGMGQVYHATDTRLNRVVALKVLPKALALDPQFRARFNREAQSIASLTHPHIGTLHDIGHQDGVDFLVMEYVEGETLAARLRKGPLSLHDGLKCAIEIADALGVAHRMGIVHRDLKPGNIILSKGGAKLLDFGLAKPTTSLLHEGGAAVQPTTRSAAGLTTRGTIIGTLQYMAPEQLEGQEADARTDIFAFGAVVYEMLTGKKAFEGKSQASLIGAIMHAEPPALTMVQPLTPPTLDRLVKTCLSKDPDDRWQSVRDLWRELRWLHEDPIAAPHAERTKRVRLVSAVMMLLILGGVAIAIWQIRTPPAASHAARFEIAPPVGTSLPPVAPFAPEISPDGSRLAFHVVRDGERLLAIRAIDALESQVLGGTEGGSFPFWSPDGRVLAFFADGKLRKVAASGGPVQIICDAFQGLGGTWNREGVILFLAGSGASPGLFKVPAAGGQPEAIAIPLQNDETLHGRPRFLPDGQRFLYFVQPDAVYLASLDGGGATRVPAAADTALYAPPGYLVLRQGRTLVAQRFNAELSQTVGDPVVVAQDVVGASLFGAPRGAASFSVSDTGVLSYASTPDAPLRLAWLDRAGRLLGTIAGLPFDVFGTVELSPDGARIAMQSPGGPDPSAEIWLFDLAQGHPAQVTFADGADRSPTWSPDGQRLVFASLRAEAPGLYQKRANGDQPEELLLRSTSLRRDEHWPTHWSSKGIIYVSGNSRENDDVWLLPVDTDRKPYPIISEPGQQAEARASPDGRWVAYTDRRPGRSEVFVRSLSTDGAKWRVSTTGGRRPIWGPDGKELFYVRGDGTLMAVPIESDAATFRQGVPQALFQTRHGVPEGAGGFGVSPDGQRFLIAQSANAAATASIVVVTNWQALLQPK